MFLHIRKPPNELFFANKKKTYLFCIKNFLDESLDKISILISPSYSPVKWKTIEGEGEFISFFTVFDLIDAVQGHRVAVLCNCPELALTLFELVIYG